MSSHLRAGIALGMALLSAVVASAAPATVYYVAPTGSDQWSGRLPEPNAQRTDGPFASVMRARDAIRAARAAGQLTGPVEVRIRDGVYRLSEPLVFEPEDSGTEAGPISYMAYPGERPVFSGGRPIGPFAPYQGEVLRASVPEAAGGGWYFRSLFADGQRQIRARHPNRDPEDPYRRGFLYTRPGVLGIATGALHSPGDWLEWEITVPADGEYWVWVLYAHAMNSLGRPDMGGQTSLRVDDGPPVPLMNLPDSGGWREYTWSQTARLTMSAGRHTVHWHNDKGGGFNMDAFVATDDPDWKPDRWVLPPPAEGRHLIVWQAEEFVRYQGIQIVPRAPGYQAEMTETRFICAPGDVRAAWAQEPDAEVHIWPSSPKSCRAFNEILRLEAVNESTGEVTVSGKEAKVPICAGDRYFIENVRELLDSPGEWYLDTTEGAVYWWPAAPAGAGTTAVAPVLTRLVELRGNAEAGQKVSYLRFIGLDFAETDYTPDDGFIAYGKSIDGVFDMRAAEHCRIEGCRFRNVGKSAIFCTNGNGVAIVGNEVAQGAEGGVYFINSSGQVTDNHIHDIGLIYKHAAGISFPGSSDTLIAHNHIHHTSRWGISGLSRNSVVEYNHLHDLNLETYDTGGIEVTQHDREFRSGTEVRYNLVHDTGGYSSLMGQDMWNSWGIYLDSFASGFSVHHNVTYRCPYGGVMVQGGRDNRIFNNIFAECGPQRQVTVNNFQNHCTGIEITGNIICARDPAAQLVRCGREVTPQVLTCDRNLYWHYAGEPVFYLPGPEPYQSWFRSLQAWQELGFDRNSRVEDPRFVDPEHDDYRLQADSPALAMGFEPIDLSSVGPRPGVGVN